MSEREWKPGDVAATEFRGVESRAFVVEGRACPDAHPRIAHWHAKGGGWNPLNDREVTYRPLVVIDPEDEDTLRDLRRAYERKAVDITGGIRYVTAEEAVDALQATLREFANPSPPKPPEPQGLGAVVEDADGRQFVRIQTHYTCPWMQRGVAGVLWKWENVAAVKVLSEGVPA